MKLRKEPLLLWLQYLGGFWESKWSPLLRLGQTPDCRARPGVSTLRITTLGCPWSRQWLHQQIVTCLMPLIKRWEGLRLHVRCAPDSPAILILGKTFVFFFPRVQRQNDMLLKFTRGWSIFFFFLELAVNFVLLRNEPTFSQGDVSVPAF